MRPRWLWARFADRGGRFVLNAGEALVFPVSPRQWHARLFRAQGFGHMHRWIGVQPEASPVCYFYPSSSAVDAILDAVQDAGFAVSLDEQPFEEA